MHLPTMNPFHAFLEIVVVATFVGSVNSVWTCPSERQPICCAKYEPEGSGSEAFIGSECTYPVLGGRGTFLIKLLSNVDAYSGYL